MMRALKHNISQRKHPFNWAPGLIMVLNTPLAQGRSVCRQRLLLLLGLSMSHVDLL